MKFRRRKYINDTGLQMKFVGPFVIVSLFGGILTSVIFNSLALKKFESLAWRTHINLETTGDLIRPLFIYINIINFLLVAVLLTIVGTWMIRKTSGPLYRMLKDVRKVASGDLSAGITLRQNDELKDTAYELDAMVKSIKDRFVVINEKYTDISKSIGGLKRGHSDKETSIKAHGSILEKIEALETEINGFKL